MIVTVLFFLAAICFVVATLPSPNRFALSRAAGPVLCHLYAFRRNRSAMKKLLVIGAKNFKIDIPDDAKVTFGPFSPPRSKGNGYTDASKLAGTLRIYRGSKDNIIACFTEVYGFRDLSMGYMEEVAKEEGATIWKSDDKGYQREEKVVRDSTWVDPIGAITHEPAKRAKK